MHVWDSKMMGSFLIRGLVMILGYAYPAYECFKVVEKNKPDIEQLRFWCQYWILVAFLTILERFGDTFISWVPMYGEAKLAFFVYLWYPKTRGTTYVYDTFLRPYVSKHETEIDRNILELRARAGDMAVLYWQRSARYIQGRVFEILQYVASQSAHPRTSQAAPPPLQPIGNASQPQKLSGVQKSGSDASTRQPTNQAQKMVSEVQPSNSEENQRLEIARTTSSHPTPATSSAAAPTVSGQSSTESPSETSSKEVEKIQSETPIEVTSDNSNPPPPQEIAMEELIPATRARLRKTRGSASQ